MSCPALPTFAAGDDVTLAVRLQVVDPTTREYEDEDTTGWAGTACLLSLDESSRVTPAVTCTVSAPGVISVPFASADTLALAAGTYLLDVRRTDGGGRRTYLRPRVALVKARPA